MRKKKVKEEEEEENKHTIAFQPSLLHTAEQEEENEEVKDKKKTKNTKNKPQWRQGNRPSLAVSPGSRFLEVWAHTCSTDQTMCQL